MLLVVAALAVAIPAISLEPGVAHAQGGGEDCGPGGGADCVYRVTRAFHVDDTEPWIIKGDPVTGHVYVASRPSTASADDEYAHLRIYDSHANGHKLIKDIRFNGSNSRIVDFEINNKTREIHLVHLWGVGDVGQGWDEVASNNDGKVDLTIISIDAYEIVKTIKLSQTEMMVPDNSSMVNVDRYTAWDVAVDEERHITYVSSMPGPILVVNTSSATFSNANVIRDNGSRTDPIWYAYDLYTPVSAMAVHPDKGWVYCRYRNRDPVSNASIPDLAY